MKCNAPDAHDANACHGHDDATHLSLPLPESTRARPEGEEWEIAKIVGRRRTRWGYIYNVEWSRSWLHSSRLENAQEMVQDFNANHPAREIKNVKAPRGNRW